MTATKLSRTRSTEASAPDVAVKPVRGSCTSPAITGLVIGTLTCITEEMRYLVNFRGNPATEPALAKALTTLTAADIGKNVAILFEDSDLHKPIIMGLIFASAIQTDANTAGDIVTLLNGPVQVIAKDNEVTVMAGRKLTLKCGAASITLDVDGNIEIRGENLLSRAARQNRIKGSSVSIN